MSDQQMLDELKEYIEFHLSIENLVLHNKMQDLDYTIQAESFSLEMDDYIKNHRQPTVHQVLFSFIDEKG